MTHMRKPTLDSFLEELEPRVVPTLPQPSHVVIVVEENHRASQIIGNSAAPYMNSLANQGALMTNSFALEHPLVSYSGCTAG
jgi:hypothetical protein